MWSSFASLASGNGEYDTEEEREEAQRRMQAAREESREDGSSMMGASHLHGLPSASSVGNSAPGGDAETGTVRTLTGLPVSHYIAERVKHKGHEWRLQAQKQSEMLCAKLVLVLALVVLAVDIAAGLLRKAWLPASIVLVLVAVLFGMSLLLSLRLTKTTVRFNDDTVQVTATRERVCFASCRNREITRSPYREMGPATMVPTNSSENNQRLFVITMRCGDATIQLEFVKGTLHAMQAVTEWQLFLNQRHSVAGMAGHQAPQQFSSIYASGNNKHTKQQQTQEEAQLQQQQQGHSGYGSDARDHARGGGTGSSLHPRPGGGSGRLSESNGVQESLLDNAVAADPSVTRHAQPSHGDEDHGPAYQSMGGESDVMSTSAPGTFWTWLVGDRQRSDSMDSESAYNTPAI